MSLVLNHEQQQQQQKTISRQIKAYLYATN